MDKNKDILGQMLQDWCQSWIDGPDWSGCGLEWDETEDNSPEWDEDNELDWGYDLEELEWNPHYECEDDDPNIEEDW